MSEAAREAAIQKIIEDSPNLREEDRLWLAARISEIEKRIEGDIVEGRTYLESIMNQRHVKHAVIERMRARLSKLINMGAPAVGIGPLAAILYSVDEATLEKVSEALVSRESAIGVLAVLLVWAIAQGVVTTQADLEKADTDKEALIRIAERLAKQK